MRRTGTTLPGTSAAGLAGLTVGTLNPIQSPNPRVRSNAPLSQSRLLAPLSVAIETEEGSNEFEPTERFTTPNIKLAQDGGDTTATLTAGLDADKLTAGGSIGDEHFAHLLDTLHADRRVRIVQPYGLSPAHVYFQGYPQVPTISWSQRHQRVSCTCLSEPQEILRTSELAQIYERRMRRTPNEAWNAEHPDDKGVEFPLPVFNAGGRPNRSSEAYPFEHDDKIYRIHLFLEDAAPLAGYWSFAEALRYILFFYVLRYGLPVNVMPFLADTEGLADADPMPEAYDPLERALSQRVPDIGVASVSVEAAINLLCQAAGAHYRLETYNTSTTAAIVVEHGLNVFAPPVTAEDAEFVPSGNQMDRPRAVDIPRLPPFADHTQYSDCSFALANRAQQATLTHDRRAINRPIVLGGQKIYEVTLLLRPGWLPHEQLDNLVVTDGTPEENEEATKANRVAAAAWWNEQFETPPDPETGIPYSKYHGRHPDHLSVNDVMRFWVFPDDARMIDAEEESPYGRINWPAALYSPYDPVYPDQNVLVNSKIGGSIDDAAYWVPRRRPLGDLIARARESGEQAAILRFHFEHSDPMTALAAEGWIRYPGKPHIDPTRAAVHILEDNLFAKSLLRYPDEPGAEYGESLLRAYIFGQLQVAVTCTIRSDDRLRYWGGFAGGSFSRKRCAVHDSGLETFQLRDRRGGNSHLNSEPTDADPRYEDRWDIDRLGARAKQLGRILGGDTVSGVIEIPWVDPSYQLGDTFTGCSGLAVEFDRYPAIVRVEYAHDENAGQRTLLHLSDLRHGPDVDQEAVA